MCAILEEGEENPSEQAGRVTYFFTLDELMKGGSNEIHSIASHEQVFN